MNKNIIIIFSLFPILFFHCGKNETDPLAVKKYAAFLDQQRSDDFYSIGKGVNYFKENFADLSEMTTDSAFIEFRNFYYVVINEGNSIMWMDEEFQSEFWKDSSEYSPRVNAFLDSLHNNGLRLSSSEGFFYIDEDPEFLHKNFKDFISESIEEYLKIRMNELEEGFADDAELLISYDQLTERILYWEKYLKKYPNSFLKNDAQFNYSLYLNTFITGMDNSSIWDEEWKLTPEMKETYLKFFKENEGKQSAQLVSDYYSLLEKNNFEYNDDILRFYEERLPDLMMGDELPVN
jgi:hypothetical protein